MTEQQQAAMRQALEALEYWDVHGKLHQPTEEAITALRQALEQQPADEPEWLTGCPDCGMDSGCDCEGGTYNPQPAAPAIPEGMRLVPVEPTNEMAMAGLKSGRIVLPIDMMQAYKAMLAAAPEQKGGAA